MRSKCDKALLAGCAVIGAIVAGCAADVDSAGSTPVPSEPELVVERGDKLAAFFHLDEARAGYEDEPALSRAERNEALSIMKARGIDVSRARYFDNDWVIAGDVIYDARALLREGDVIVDKGYFFQNATAVVNYRPIYMTGDPAYPVNWAWAYAAIYGAADWNNKTHVLFTTENPFAGQTTLYIQQGPFSQLLGPGYDCYLALTTLPTGGRPGIIGINSGFNCTDPTAPAACRIGFLSVSWDQALHTMTHEIGHALGFAHPAWSGSTRITGTSSAPNPNNPSYPSVMWGGANGCFPGNANVTLGLSQDDINSANAKYR